MRRLHRQRAPPKGLHGYADVAQGGIGPLMAVQDAIPAVVSRPVRAFGGFFSMTLDVFILMFRPPFAWREYILQSWFVARV